jgi:hypothetical protein
MTDYLEGFYDDWGGYIFAILAFAFSFILTRNISTMLLVTAAGLFLIFILFGNILFLAGSIICLAVGLLMKYISG